MASFVMWDDNGHIAQSVRFSPPALHWVADFWRHTYFGLYVPVTYTIWLLVGCAVSASAPIAAEGGAFVPAWPFHLLNVLTHLAAACVAWRLLRKAGFSAQAAWWGAILFAVHPLQVEPVAWVSGFRDVLGGLLLLAALTRLLSAIDGPATRRDYLLATFLFGAALLSKPSSAAGPLLGAVLLWTFRDVSWKRIAILLLPWAAMAAACLAVTKMLQPTALPTASVSLLARLLVAADALGFYVWKFVAPWPLGIDYGRTPQWLVNGGWKNGLWLIPLGIACGLLWMSRRVRGALLWTVAGLLPVLGLVGFNFQSYSTVADRYLYVSMLGPAMLMAMVISRWPQTTRYVTVLVLVWVAMSFGQSMVWKNTVTLFTHAMAVNTNSFLAPATLAAVALDRGQAPVALAFANRSIALNADFGSSRVAAGNALRMLSRFPEAESAYREAVRIEPENAAAWSNLAAVLGQENKIADAKSAITTALRLGPDSPDAHVNAGMIAVQANDVAEAIREFRFAVTLAPGNVSARMNLAILLERGGDKVGAATQLRELLALYPSLAAARKMLQSLQ